MKTSKIILSLIAAIILIGCRSAKPTSSYEILADSVAISADSTFSLRQDSASISDKARIMTDNKINFVEGGGAIFISSDGSVALSGVAGVRYFNSSNSERRKTKGSLNVQSHTKDSIAFSHQSTSHAETRHMVSSVGLGWKLKIAFVSLFVLMILIVIAKCRKYN